MMRLGNVRLEETRSRISAAIPAFRNTCMVRPVLTGNNAEQI